MFDGKSISQFLNTFSDCSFETKISLLDLFLKNTNANFKQVWNSLKEATNAEYSKESKLDQKLSYLALFLVLIRCDDHVQIDRASIEVYLEQFLSILTLEEYSLVQYKVFNELCEALVFSSGSEILEYLFEKAILQLESFCHEEESPIGRSLSLLCFLSPQIFHFCEHEQRDSRQELLTKLQEVILEALHYKTLQDICLKTLLPPVIQEIKSTQSEDVVMCFGKRLFTKLKQLLTEGEQEVALTGFVQFLDFIDQTNSSFCQDDALLIRLQSLISEDGTLTKKRSFFILEKVWLRDRTPWKRAFLSLYSALDEFGLYLVQQDWNKIGALQGMTNEVSPPPEVCSWSPIIWTKGFKHKNHQVQRLVLKTFLEREWDSKFLTHISFEFLLEIFIPCLASTHIQGDPNESNHQLNGEEFLKKYVEFLDQSLRVEFGMEFLKRVFIADVSRGAFQSGICCFAAIAPWIKSSILTQTQTNLILKQFQVLVGMVSNIQGAGFKLSLYQGILSSLKTLIPLSLASWSCLISLLASFPAFLSCHGAALNPEIRNWILEDSKKDQDCLNLALSSMMEFVFSTGSLQECRKLSNQFITVFLQFCLDISASCLELIELLSPVLMRLYRQSYPNKEQETKVLLFTHSLLQACLKSVGQVPAGIDRRLALLLTECLEELYSYGMICIDSISSKVDTMSESGELALSCLAVAKQYFTGADSKFKDMGYQLGQKCSSLVTKIFSGSSHFFKENETDLKDMEVRNQLLKCLKVLSSSISLETDVSQYLEVLLSFHDDQTLIKNASYEDPEPYRWTCIHGLTSSCSLDHCTINFKASIMRKILEDWESLDEALLLTMIQIIHPMVKELYRNEVFTARVYSLVAKEGFEETSWTVKLRTVMWSVVRSLWAAFIGPKKTIENCSALTELIYLPEAFRSVISPSLMHQNHVLKDSLDLLHGDDGPISWITMKLMELGTRSPRVLLLTAIHLLKCLQQGLHLVEYYVPCLTSLVLHDARDRGQADFKDSQMLNKQIQIMDDDLLFAFQSSVIAPRIAFSCFVHSLSQKASLQKNTPLNCHPSNSIEGRFVTSFYIAIWVCLEEVGYRLWEHFLEVVMTDELQKQTQYRVGSQTHRAKLRVWQTLTLLTPFVTTKDQIQNSLEQLTIILKEGNTASVRMYVELTTCYLLQKDPTLLNSYIFPIIKNYEKRHEALPGYILIAYQVGMSCEDPDLRKKMLTDLVCSVFPWTMSHNHSTRAFAQLTLDALIQRLPELKSLLNTQWTDTEGDRLNPWPSLGRYLADNKDLNRLKKGLGRSLKQLESSRRGEVCLKTVFQIPDEKEPESIAFEAAPEPLIEKIQFFLAEERIKVRDANIEQVIAKESGSTNTPQIKKDSNSGSKIENTVQRKITTPEEHALIHGGDITQPWKLSIETLSNLNAPLHDSEDLLNSCRIKVKTKQEIVVVASLIDKIPNLAGLARTCEVFQAKQLVISDLNVIKTHQFTSISVTAEELIDIIEVRPEALHPWLLQKQSEGFQLLAVEQTSTSKLLGEFKFSEKCVVLLGKEKEGIPADFLQLMNDTIEIPQLGFIRSLNVHVSGAIALFEYTRQQRT